MLGWYKNMNDNQLFALVTLYFLSRESSNIKASDIAVVMNSVPRNVAANMKHLYVLGMVDIGWAVGCKGKTRAYKIKDIGIDFVKRLKEKDKCGCVIDETAGGIVTQEQEHEGQHNG